MMILASYSPFPAKWSKTYPAREFRIPNNQPSSSSEGVTPSSSSEDAPSSSSEDAPSSSSVGADNNQPSSSSEGVTPSSSSEDAPSSSSEGNTPIQNRANPSSTGVARNAPTYYNLKGEPLGTQKPTTSGVYIEKQGKQTKKIMIP